MPTVSASNAEAGASIFGGLSPDRQEFYRKVSAQMLLGNVLTHQDVATALLTTRSSHPASSDFKEPSKILITSTASDVLLHLKVVLHRGFYSDILVETYHDLQIPPQETNMEQVVRRLGGLEPGSELSPLQQYHLEAWQQRAQEEHELLLAN